MLFNLSFFKNTPFAITWIFISVIVLLLSQWPAAGHAEPPGKDGSAREMRLATVRDLGGKVLIGYHSAPGQQDVLAIEQQGGRVKRVFTCVPVIAAVVPVSDVESFLDAWDHNPAVDYVEPDYLRQPAGVPDDPYFVSQWALDNNSDIDIDAPEAWDLTTGDPSVIVGILDGGIDVTHQDLNPNMWVNPGEIPGNGIDDDLNGYVDDIAGWNFYNDNSQLFPGDYRDDHGTHVAGVIGAQGNNSAGTAGINWGVNLMGLKFIGNDGGSVSHEIEGIQYASDNGARIINASFGGYGFSATEEAAIAAHPDILFIASAGNDNVDTDVTPYYPACYSLPNLISVTAIDQTGDLCYWGVEDGSNWGPMTVHIAAPGDEILSTFPGGWELFSGSSIATAHVSGVAALLLSVDPTLPPVVLRDLILDNAEPHQALSGLTATGGIVNAFAAVSATIETADYPRNHLPRRSALDQNFPNPFNPVTEITFSLTAPSHVTLGIYDAAGRLVEVLVNGQRSAGYHTVNWEGRGTDGRPMASGVYFYRLSAGEFEKTRKMVLLR